MRVEQANLIMEFDNGTVIKLGLQDSYQLRKQRMITKCSEKNTFQTSSHATFLLRILQCLHFSLS